MPVDQLIERAKAILISPDTEWPIVADERTTIGELYRNYVIALAAIPAIASFIKTSLIGIDVPLIGSMRVDIGPGLAGTGVGYLLTLGQVYAIATIVDALAPTFGAQRNQMQAFKLTAYAFTAAWVAGIGRIVPVIGVLLPLAGGLYSLYLFHAGLPVLMKCPREQTTGYALVSIVAAVVLSIVFGSVVQSVTGEPSAGDIKRSDLRFENGSPMDSVERMQRKHDDALKQLSPAQ